jgi:hypothetical protein
MISSDATTPFSGRGNGNAGEDVTIGSKLALSKEGFRHGIVVCSESIRNPRDSQLN